MSTAARALSSWATWSLSSTTVTPTGNLSPLPMKHVDTGTGLERVASVMQSLETGRYLGNYDIDLFQRIIRSIEEAAGEYGHPYRYGQRFAEADANQVQEAVEVSFRAIADHARTMSFLAAEGVVPGNTDREYVMRRIIRRAARHGRYLSIQEPFLASVCEGVVGAMSAAYPELELESARIAKVITLEEERFGETLDRGLELLNEERQRLASFEKPVLSGDFAFRLFDTYGFPLDLTQDVLRDDGIEVDVKEFNRLMEQQRERGRAARREETAAPQISLTPGVSSRFIHGRYEVESEVLAAQGDADKRVTLVAAETPFYPEGGGQVGDRGVIEARSGALLEISDTRRHDGSILHIGKLVRGDLAEFALGRPVTLRLDRARRDAAMLNHSATHVLHYALRDILGKEVHQAGSLVAPDRLRFDFSHQGPVKAGDLKTIEEEINARIRENAPVTTEEMAYDEAIKAGALAFFGDKYGDRVRVVKMGDFSTELCGGTHVNRTGDIGFFKLEAESGVAAGVRRVEAFTGQGALEAIRRREKILEDLGSQLGARDHLAIDRLQRLIAHEKELEKRVRALEQKLVTGGDVGDVSEDRVREANGVKVVTRKTVGVEAKALREMADRMRQKYGSAVVALGADLGDNKVALLVAVTSDLASRANAGDIIKQIAPIVGGTGGGRADFAQAGGRDPGKLDAALDRVAELV